MSFHVASARSRDALRTRSRRAVAVVPARPSLHDSTALSQRTTRLATAFSLHCQATRGDRRLSVSTTHSAFATPLGGTREHAVYASALASTHIQVFPATLHDCPPAYPLPPPPSICRRPTARPASLIPSPPNYRVPRVPHSPTSRLPPCHLPPLGLQHGVQRALR